MTCLGKEGPWLLRLQMQMQRLQRPEGARNVGKMGRLVDLSGGDSGMQVI